MTGGGTGLGKATALELARCSATVTIAGRRAEMLEATVAQVEGPGEADWVSADVREPDEAERLIHAVLERQELRLEYKHGAFFVRYYDERLPIAPDTYSAVMRHAIEAWHGDHDGEHADELLSVLTAAILGKIIRIASKTMNQGAKVILLLNCQHAWHAEKISVAVSINIVVDDGLPAGDGPADCR